MTNRERWLRGHHRKGSTVIIGTGLHCAGCGSLLGITSIAVIIRRWPLWVWDKHRHYRYPKWPFEEETCPIHIKESEDQAWPKGKVRPLP